MDPIDEAIASIDSREEGAACSYRKVAISLIAALYSGQTPALAKLDLRRRLTSLLEMMRQRPRVLLP
jgi:hypothetical protein